jgi:hypothetical protein
MTNRVGMVTCELTISADGFSAGLNRTEECPFGDDGAGLALPELEFRL